MYLWISLLVLVCNMVLLQESLFLKWSKSPNHQKGIVLWAVKSERIKEKLRCLEAKWFKIDELCFVLWHGIETHLASKNWGDEALDKQHSAPALYRIVFWNYWVLFLETPFGLIYINNEYINNWHWLIAEISYQSRWTDSKSTILEAAFSKMEDSFPPVFLGFKMCSRGGKSEGA